MPCAAGSAMSEREIEWKEKTSLIGLKKRHDCGGVAHWARLGDGPDRRAARTRKGALSIEITQIRRSWCSFASPMILRDRYGPRLRDEGGCRSRKRLSRLRVTLPGWRVRVTRHAYVRWTVVQILDASLLLVYPCVKRSIHGSSGLALRARFSTMSAVRRGLASRFRSQ